MALLEQSFASAVAVGSFIPSFSKCKGMVCSLGLWPSLARATVVQHLQWEAAFLVVDIQGIHEVVSLTGFVHGASLQMYGNLNGPSNLQAS